MPTSSSNAGIEIAIHEDASLARLILCADVQTATLTVAFLSQLIKEREIVCDPSLHSALEEAVAVFKEHPSRREIVIARALAAVDGEAGAIEWQAGCNPAAAAAAAPGDGGAVKVDFYNQAHYVAVSAGTHVATIRPPTPGADGRDVMNRALKAKPGAACLVKTDASVSIDGQGRITALIDGVIRFRNNTLKIMPLFEVPGSVNFSTGNIVFNGSVVIRGDVCDRFIVRAVEDVTVHGVIGAATVLCGRHLLAHCGMAAHDHGCLFVGGDAQVKYMKNGHGLVQGNLMARREMINCDLAIGGNLICDAGAVIGGTLTIAGSADVGTLGSATGTPTTLVFGTHPCQQQAADTLQLQNPPKKSSAAPRWSASQLKAQIDAFTRLTRACVDQRGNLMVGNAKNVNLTIQKFLHPGVVIRTGRCRVVVDKPMRGPIHIRGDQQGGLAYQSGDSVWHPLTDLARPMERAG